MPCRMSCNVDVDDRGAGLVKTLRRGGDVLLGRSSSSSSFSLSLSGAAAVKGNGARVVRVWERLGSYARRRGFWASVPGRVAASRRGRAARVRVSGSRRGLSGKRARAAVALPCHGAETGARGGDAGERGRGEKAAVLLSCREAGDAAEASGSRE
jgi:hypothetical protein